MSICTSLREEVVFAAFGSIWCTQQLDGSLSEEMGSFFDGWMKGGVVGSARGSVVG